MKKYDSYTEQKFKVLFYERFWIKYSNISHIHFQRTAPAILNKVDLVAQFDGV